MSRKNNRPSLHRRAFLTGLTGFISTTVLTQPVIADDDDDQKSLEYTPVWFGVYRGFGSQVEAFTYPDGPTGLNGLDDETDNGFIDGPSNLLFDASEIKRGDDQLHHILKFRQDESIVGTPVPYVLTEADDDEYDDVDELYTATGDIVDFELTYDPQKESPPFPFQGGLTFPPGAYRAVFRNGIALYDDEPEDEFKWAYTRVEGKPAIPRISAVCNLG